MTVKAPSKSAWVSVHQSEPKNKKPTNKVTWAAACALKVQSPLPSSDTQQAIYEYWKDRRI